MKRYFIFDKNLNFKSVPRFENKKGNQLKNNKVPIVNILNIGYYILAPLLMGVFLGLAIDRWFKLKGIFTLLFLFIGWIGSLYNLYKIYKNYKNGKAAY